MAPRHHAHPATRALAAIGAGTLLFYGSRILLNFFGPALAYSMRGDSTYDLTADDFLRFLSTVTGGAVRHVRLTRLRNGEEFYPAELEAIRNAQHSINLETYEFLPGAVGQRFLDAMIERARAGVQVRLIVDALGSFSTPRSYFRDLLAAGGQMHFYHALHWNTWQQVNNRTHRKILIVDGRTGFLGGAGIGDCWLYPTPTVPVWRDTFFRVEGDAVAGLTSTFSENWLEAAGEILSEPEQFAYHHLPQASLGFVVSGTPHGGGTFSRVLFQALINSATSSLVITTPYFLPDRSARNALIAAVRRGVSVRILTAGPRIDHPAIRTLSHHSSHQLIRAGAEIFEYQPAMIHAKLLTVDRQWVVIGSTNFDHRSFALNDEVNLAARDPGLAALIEADFEADLGSSSPLSLATLERSARSLLASPLVDHILTQES